MSTFLNPTDKARYNAVLEFLAEQSEDTIVTIYNAYCETHNMGETLMPMDLDSVLERMSAADAYELGCSGFDTNDTWMYFDDVYGWESTNDIDVVVNRSELAEYLTEYGCPRECKLDYTDMWDAFAEWVKTFHHHTEEESILLMTIAQGLRYRDDADILNVYWDEIYSDALEQMNEDENEENED